MEIRRIPGIIIRWLSVILVLTLVPSVAMAKHTATLDEQLREAAERGDLALVRTGGVTAVHNALPVLGINSDEKDTHRIARERGHTVLLRASLDPSITVDKTSIRFTEKNIRQGEVINVDNNSGFDQTLGISLPQKGLLYSSIVSKPEQVKMPHENWKRFSVPTNSGIFIIITPESDPAQIEMLDGEEIVIKVYDGNEVRETRRIPIKVGSVRQTPKTADAQKRNGWTKLMSFAHMGRTDLVKELLEKGADVNAKDKIGWTPLIYAAQGWPREHADTVKFLLDRGADVNARDASGRTPLMYAARAGHVEVVKLLLKKGADVNAMDRTRATAMTWSCRSGHRDIVRLLTGHGAQMTLTDAAYLGDVERVQRLIREGLFVDSNGAYGQTPLMVAAERGHLEVVKVLVDKGADVNAKDRSDRTALMEAASKGRLEVVKLLVGMGADVDAKGKMDWTALMTAVAEGHLKVVQVMLDKGADVNARTEDAETALEIAQKRGRKAIVELLKAQGAKE
jgi:ankyrin repeat protein